MHINTVFLIKENHWNHQSENLTSEDFKLSTVETSTNFNGLSDVYSCILRTFQWMEHFAPGFSMEEFLTSFVLSK